MSSIVKDFQSGCQVDSVKEDFARDMGWPKVRKVILTPENWNSLARIEGSFAAQEPPLDCPANDQITCAFYDLLPRLIAGGHDGKHLAFGFCRENYAIGDSGKEAMANLISSFAFEMPIAISLISKERMESGLAKEYYAWKQSRGIQMSEWGFTYGDR